MNNRIFSRVLLGVAVIMFGCIKDNASLPQSDQTENVAALKKGGGATQLSGVGRYAATGECEPSPDGASAAIAMTGDLEGCLYVFIDAFECSPSGTYREEGREYFVGTYNGNAGTFWTTYKFEAKFEGCAENGAPLGAEIFGRCQHPIVSGSGDGVFEGVTGRLDFKDNVVTGDFPYRGHLKF